MNYQLSEAEFFRIQGVGHQISLMFDLVIAIVNKQYIEIGAENLSSFLGAQKDELEAVLKTVDERYDAQRVLDEGIGALNWIDWCHALRIVSGDAAHTPHGASETIERKLAAAATVNPDWRAAEAVWKEALGRQHAAPNAGAAQAGAKGKTAGNSTRSRKRAHLTA